MCPAHASCRHATRRHTGCRCARRTCGHRPEAAARIAQEWARARNGRAHFVAMATQHAPFLACLLDCGQVSCCQQCQQQPDCERPRLPCPNPAPAQPRNAASSIPPGWVYACMQPTHAAAPARPLGLAAAPQPLVRVSVGIRLLADAMLQVGGPIADVASSIRGLKRAIPLQHNAALLPWATRTRKARCKGAHGYTHSQINQQQAGAAMVLAPKKEATASTCELSARDPNLRSQHPPP